MQALLLVAGRYILWNYIVPAAIAALKRSGAINWAEALAAKAYVNVKTAAQNIELTADYPKAQGESHTSQQAWKGPEKPDQNTEPKATFLGMDVEASYPENKKK